GFGLQIAERIVRRYEIAARADLEFTEGFIRRMIDKLRRRGNEARNIERDARCTRIGEGFADVAAEWQTHLLDRGRLGGNAQQLRVGTMARKYIQSIRCGV